MAARRFMTLLGLVFIVVFGSVAAQPQSHFHGDLAVSWLKGKVKRVENQTARRVLYYDREGYLTEMIVNDKPVSLIVESRDSEGRPLRLVRRDNPEATGLLAIYTYDDKGRVLTLIYKDYVTGKKHFSYRYIYEGDSDYPCGYVETWGERELPENFRLGDPNTLELTFGSFDKNGNPTVLNHGGVVDDIFIIEYYPE